MGGIHAGRGLLATGAGGGRPFLHELGWDFEWVLGALFLPWRESEQQTAARGDGVVHVEMGRKRKY